MSVGVIEAAEQSSTAGNKPVGSIYGWSLLTWRLFHWRLVVFVAISWWTGGTGDSIHEITGYAIAGFIIFRIFWGFAGTKHVKYTPFAHSPLRTYRYLHGILSGKSKRQRGRNPTSGLIIFAIVIALIILIATGIMMQTVMFFGVSWVEKTHEYASDILLVMIALHILSIIYSRYKRVLQIATQIAKTADGLRYNIMQHIRGAEGFMLLITAAIIGGVYGWTTTAGRVVTFINQTTQQVAAISTSVEPPPQSEKFKPQLIVAEEPTTQNASISASAAQKPLRATEIKAQYYSPVAPEICIIHICK